LETSQIARFGMIFAPDHITELLFFDSTVHGLTFNVQKLFMDMDARLWEECSQRHKLNMERATQAQLVCKQKWDQLERAAQQKIGA
jgi:hypothetical protein